MTPGTAEGIPGIARDIPGTAEGTPGTARGTPEPPVGPSPDPGPGEGRLPSAALQPGEPAVGRSPPLAGLRRWRSLSTGPCSAAHAGKRRETPGNTGKRREAPGNTGPHSLGPPPPSRQGSLSQPARRKCRPAPRGSVVRAGHGRGRGPRTGTSTGTGTGTAGAAHTAAQVPRGGTGPRVRLWKCRAFLSPGQC